MLAGNLTELSRLPLLSVVISTTSGFHPLLRSRPFTMRSMLPSPLTSAYTRLPRKYAVDTPPGSVISLYCGFCEAAKAVPAEAIRAETR